MKYDTSSCFWNFWNLFKFLRFRMNFDISNCFWHFEIFEISDKFWNFKLFLKFLKNLYVRMIEIWNVEIASSFSFLKSFWIFIWYTVFRNFKNEVSIFPCIMIYLFYKEDWKWITSDLVKVKERRSYRLIEGDMHMGIESK